MAPPLPGTGLPARPGTGMYVKLVAPQAVALRGNELLVLDAGSGFTFFDQYAASRLGVQLAALDQESSYIKFFGGLATALALAVLGVTAAAPVAAPQPPSNEAATRAERRALVGHPVGEAAARVAGRGVARVAGAGVAAGVVASESGVFSAAGPLAGGGVVSTMGAASGVAGAGRTRPPRRISSLRLVS